MPLYKNTPKPSGRMGVLWALAPIYDSAIIEFGSMGHMIYAHKWIDNTGLIRSANLITTHLTEKDIALGITKRLEESVKEVIQKGEAKVIFLIPSSVPEMVGTDLEAIGEELQFIYPDFPIITFKAGNFKASKKQGIEEAYYQLVKSLPDKMEDITAEEQEIPCFNLMGPACDYSRFQADRRELSRMMERAFHLQEGAIFGSSTDTKSLLRLTKAKITLVVHEEGLKAAKELEKRYGIPYLYQSPYGASQSIEWIEKLEELLQCKADQAFMEKEKLEMQYVIKHCKSWTDYAKNKSKIWISGEDELAKGITEFAVKDLGFSFEQGEIHMSDAQDLKINPGITNIEVRRSTLSHDINPYEQPFMGFRGAMNLSSLWYYHLAK